MTLKIIIFQRFHSPHSRTRNLNKLLWEFLRRQISAFLSVRTVINCTYQRLRTWSTQCKVQRKIIVEMQSSEMKWNAIFTNIHAEFFKLIWWQLLSTMFKTTNPKQKRKRYNSENSRVDFTVTRYTVCIDNGLEWWCKLIRFEMCGRNDFIHCWHHRQLRSWIRGQCLNNCLLNRWIGKIDTI